MSEKHQFKISSSLKDVIGRDLITDDFVAIFELVKNSFDAYAENVNLHFYLEEKEAKIFIVDDGKGMNKNDIIKKWLFVAFSAKKNKTEDIEKRTYSGYKGIGRFSCDRLGKKLNLYSKTKESNTIHFISVNWDDFEEDSTKEFVNIDVEYTEKKTLSLPDNITIDKNGVILEILLLRNLESWDRKKLIKLKMSLQKLIDPIGDIRNIFIHCNSQLALDKKIIEGDEENYALRVNGPVENNIFKVLEGKTTTIKAQIVDNGNLIVDLIDRGVFIYKTSENISNIYSELIDSSFHLELSFLNFASKNIFKRRMRIHSVKYGSLLLIRNGFRVFPIGEENNDYWGFDRRKQQGYARYLGSRDLLGFVKISGNENKFKESSSRNQGLIQTNAAKQLTEIVKLCLLKLEAYVVDITWKDKIDKEHSNFERMKLDINKYRIIELIEGISNSKNIKVIDYNHDLISILNEKAKDFEPALNKLKNIADLLNDEKLIKQIKLAEKVMITAKIAQQDALRLAEKEHLARLEAEKKVIETSEKAEKISEEKRKLESEYNEEIKRNLFLTSSNLRDKELLEGFIHQLIIYASDSKARLQNLLQFPENLKNKSPKELLDIFSFLYEINEKIISTSRFATTANFRLKSSMIDEDLNIFISEYIEKIASAYNSKIKITTELDSKSFILKFNPIEIGMILENLINNSKKAKASTIKFSSSIKANIFELIIEDNGLGLDQNISNINRIFDKGYSRTNGSGLGLFFSKERIEAMGGEIKLTEKQPIRGARFIIRMVKK